MLCNRLQEQLISKQGPEQAAYRAGYSTEDHLVSTTLLLERAAEWNVDIWLALVDFEKAFDSVEHDALWQVLERQGINDAYVRLLRKLYEDQQATVLVGKESKSFALERGVKQGDPISGLLFIAVMQEICANLKSRWTRLNSRRKGHYYGIVVDSAGAPLLELRFADDVMLIASSKQDIGKMIVDLAKEAAQSAA